MSAATMADGPRPRLLTHQCTDDDPRAARRAVECAATGAPVPVRPVSRRGGPPARAAGRRPRRGRRLWAVALLAGAAVLLTLVSAAKASAHPLGNFTVNQYDGLVVAPHTLRVDHVEDLAEIPARQARPDIDRDGDGRLAPAELDRWAGARCATAARGARAGAGAERLRLGARHALARTRPGQAGLATLRVECRLTAALPRDAAGPLTYRPATVANGPGWREMTARGDRMTLAGGVPRTSASARLTAYPRGLLSSPPHRTAVTLRVTPGGPALATQQPSRQAAGGILPRGADRWTQGLTSLVARHDLGPGFAALALGIAVLLGALHALAPGHGKTMMAAAAAAGGRRTRRDMVALGASVTVTHTLGVFVLGTLAIAGSSAAPSVIAWLGVASGALVTVAGVSLVRRQLKGRRHDHHNPHDHDHDHDHTHDHPHTHDHHNPHDHDHRHAHNHSRPLSLRGVLLLGFAGGLVPSPSAVLVLIGASALGRAWFGFLLVLGYGAGLALTLTAAGFAALRLGQQAARVAAKRAAHPLLRRMRRAAPLGSGAVVLALGCGLVLKGAAAALG